MVDYLHVLETVVAKNVDLPGQIGYVIKGIDRGPINVSTNFDFVCWAMLQGVCLKKMSEHILGSGDKKIISMYWNCKWFDTSRCYQIAVQNKQLDILQWLYACKHNKPLESYLYSSAIRVDDECIVDWLFENKCPVSRRACDSAASHGNLKLLKKLVNMGRFGYDLGNTALSLAAQNNHGEIVEFLIDNGCEFHVSSLASAATTGNLDLLKMMCDKPRCPGLYEYAFTMAAQCGHIHVMEWLYDRGCPWGVSTTSMAAMRGNLECLKWLRSKNPPCPWDGELYSQAAYRREIDVLEWAFENGCPLASSKCTGLDIRCLSHLDKDVQAWIKTHLFP